MAKHTSKSKSKSASYAEKESIVKRLNERMASIIRHAGRDNQEYNAWVTKLTRPRSPYETTTKKYDPSKIQLEKNKGAVSEKLEYVSLSRRKADIEKMSLEDLKRLEEQTKGWGTVKKEAKETLESQQKRQAQLDQVSDEYNPFIDIEAAAEAEIAPISEADIVNYLNQKEAVRQFIEGNSDAFYALIEATGWDDIQDHTTEEIYQKIIDLDLNNYQFDSTLSEIGEAYIQRRNAAQERRRYLGF